MKDNIEKTIAGYEKIAEQYRKVTDRLDMTKQADLFEKMINGNPERIDSILDLGCGPGRDAEYFAKMGFDVTGIDLTERFLEMARERVPTEKFFKMDMRNLVFEDKSFEGIWACASLLHLSKKEISPVIKRLNDILVPEGILYASLKKGEGEELKHDPCYGGSDKFYAYYGLREIEEIMEQNSFEICNLPYGNCGVFVDIFCKKK